MHVINLSLGTINKSHNERFQQVIARAVAHNIAIVSASEISGEKAWPGCSPHVIGVGLDWECPRDSFGYESNGERITFTTSGYPRSIPGVPPERNLSGISFAVANMTGFVVRAKEAFPDLPVRELESLLAGEGRGVS
jgi:hypothetical protein